MRGGNIGGQADVSDSWYHEASCAVAVFGRYMTVSKSVTFRSANVV